MKKIFANRFLFLPVLFLALAIGYSSCQKDTDGSPDIKAGTPVLKSVTPAEAAGGSLVTVEGTGLGDIRSIVFDNNNVPTSIMSTLNTDSHILFRVPDTAFGGNQNIILTNSEGKTLSVPFKVIALPIISTAYPLDFQAGSTVTITGNNLDDVTSVQIDGTTEEATVVSKSRKKLVLAMPTSAVDKGKLKITNLSGSNVSTQEFVNIDKALPVFTDALQNGFESWSWGGTFEASADDFITGSKSMKAAYDPTGSWGGMQLGNGGSIDISAYRYFAFWAKGTDADVKVQVNLNWAGWQEFTIPAKVWTYFKYDMLSTYPGMTSVNNVTYQIMGDGKTVYFDNIVFIK